MAVSPKRSARWHRKHKLLELMLNRYQKINLFKTTQKKVEFVFQLLFFFFAQRKIGADAILRTVYAPKPLPLELKHISPLLFERSSPEYVQWISSWGSPALTTQMKTAETNTERISISASRFSGKTDASLGFTLCF